MLRIALASPPVSGSVDAAMPWVERFIAEAAEGEADIVCFPECYIPGLRGQDFAVEPHDPDRLAAVRERVQRLAAAHGIAVIIPMDWGSPEGILNVAFVISAEGELLGRQTKNQLAPSRSTPICNSTTRGRRPMQRSRRLEQFDDESPSESYAFTRRIADAYFHCPHRRRNRHALRPAPIRGTRSGRASRWRPAPARCSACSSPTGPARRRFSGRCSDCCWRRAGA